MAPLRRLAALLASSSSVADAKGIDRDTDGAAGDGKVKGFVKPEAEVVGTAPKIGAVLHPESESSVCLAESVAIAFAFLRPS
mgnify:FL=1